MKTLREFITEASQYSELFDDICNAKSNDKFIENCTKLGEVLSPERSKDTSDIYCIITSMKGYNSDPNTNNVLIKVGKYSKKKYICVCWNERNNITQIDKLNAFIQDTSTSGAIYKGFLPKEIKIRF
jgi:hypothetical protein